MYRLLLALLVTAPLLAEDPATNIERGLVQPDFQKPVSIFSRAFYASRPKRGLAEAMAEYHVPGVSLALIEDGRTLATRAYGSAGPGAAVTPETRFEAGSTTKVLTAVLALRLVDQKTLDLDTDIATYLKTWRVPGGKPVTLRQLLTHRAGFNRPDKGFAWENGTQPSLQQVLDGKKPALNQAARLDTEPGSRWSYSNLGFDVIQQVLEDATGEPYARLARRLVFAPLGMEASTLGAPGDGVPWARPHDESGAPQQHLLVPGALGHGALVTTPADLAKLMIDLMASSKGKGRVLSRASANLMLTKTVDIPIFGPGPFAQGTGVMLLGGSTFLHPGSNAPGSVCWFIGNAQAGQGLVAMANGAGGEALLLEVVASAWHQRGWPDIP